MILLDGSALNIALPAIQADTGGTMAALQWLVNIYTIPLASLLLTAGVLSDRFGARRVFLWSLLGFTVASFVCAVSPNLVVLLGARCVQGIFAAGVLPTTLAIISKTYPDVAERGKAIALWGATGGLAMVVGPIGGGLLTELWGWRSIFFINVPVGAIAVWLTVRHVQETNRQSGEKFDIVGQILAFAGLVLLVGGLIESGERGWSSPVTLGMLAAAVVLLAAFVFTESRVANPSLPLGIFRTHAYTAAVIIGFAFQFGGYGLQFMYAIFVQDEWGYDAAGAGLFFVPFAVMWTFGTLVLNQLWSGRGMRWLLVTGSLIACAGAVLCMFASDRSTWPVLLGGMALVGLGCGLFAPSCAGAAMAAAPKEFAGLASGVLNTSRQVGMAIGVSLLGVCLVLGNPVTGARIGVLLTLVGFALIAALSVRFVPRPS
ncbi:MFS transporter [Nocardiopsis tropica]